MRVRGQNKKVAFTLAEMMVVLLIMTIILAAMAPVMTTRMSANKASGGGNTASSEIWKYVEDSGETDIYYGTTDNQRVMIGQNKAETAENARLILNTSDDIPNHLIFRNDNNTYGILRFESDKSILLGSLAPDTIPHKKGYIAIGKNVTVETVDYEKTYYHEINNAIAIGNNSTATGGANSYGSPIAIGSGAVANGNVAIAIGGDSKAKGEYVIAIGQDALNSAEHTSYSIAIGYKALSKLTNAAGNIAIGNFALQNFISNEFGDGSNVAIGNNALRNITTASSNTAIGNDALMNNITGNSNIAIGNSAMLRSTKGSLNVAIGNNALQNITTASSNTAIGNRALMNNITGNSNIAIGNSAAVNNIEGISNVAIGNNAMSSNKEGNYNVVIGGASMSYAKSASNNSVIGYEACKYVYGSNKTCIGKNSGPANNSTYAKDDIERIFIGSKSNYNNGDAVLEIHNEASPRVIVNGTLYAAGELQQVSDKRLKNIDKEYTSSLDKIKQLKPYNFTYKNDKNKTPRVGVIAQDLKKIFPDAVSKGKDGFLTIRLEDMFYAVINAIKELDAKITALIQTIKQVQDDNAQLKKENLELKKRIEFLEQKLIQSP